MDNLTPGILGRETVAVIGGGISGCLLALELKAIGYGNVVLFESTKDICQVATQVISELHSGAEYPFDTQSGFDCLHGLIAFKKIFPEIIFRKPRTQFLISKSSCEEGLSLDLFTNHCSALRQEYERIVSCDPSVEKILGKPTDFWKEISGSNYRDVINAIAGYETPQHGIEPMLLLNHIKSLLKLSSVDVRTLHLVEAVDYSNGKYNLLTKNLQGRFTFKANQLAFTNHFSGLGLISSIADPTFKLPEIYAALRMIVVAKHKNEMPFPRPTRFMLEGRYGAMDGPIASNFSMVYQPSISHISKIKLGLNYEIPEDWKLRMSKPTKEDQERASEIVKQAAELAYPYLSLSSVEKCLLRIAINTVEESRQRRNPGVLVPRRDCVSLSLTTKATCAALNAQNAAIILANEALLRS